MRMIKLILALVAAPLSVIAAARALSGTWEIHELPDDDALWWTTRVLTHVD